MIFECKGRTIGFTIFLMYENVQYKIGKTPKVITMWTLGIKLGICKLA
jgi:hypothetical protein